MILDDTIIEFGPGLNLIIGPNGCGKSSVVCGIGMALGIQAKSLKRGDKQREFIKWGRNQAFVEIELFNAIDNNSKWSNNNNRNKKNTQNNKNHANSQQSINYENATIKRLLTRKDASPAWTINGSFKNNPKQTKN